MERQQKRQSYRQPPVGPHRLIFLCSLISGALGIMFISLPVYCFLSFPIYVSSEGLISLIPGALGLAACIGMYRKRPWALIPAILLFLTSAALSVISYGLTLFVIAAVLELAAVVLYIAKRGPRHSSEKTRKDPSTKNLDCESASSRKGDIINQRYQVIDQIGVGATGSVYLVRDMKSHDQKAQWVLKEIPLLYSSPEEKSEREALFQRECSLLSSLNHPSIPKLIEYSMAGDVSYIVMEPVSGENLETTLKESGKPLPVKTALKLARELSQILSYLHHQQPHPLIYRDLKPSNIIITVSGKVKLIDFGIARIFNPEKVKDTYVYGTPGFSPPEQYGTGQTDERSDIYSLGATLYFALTLEDPLSFNFNFPPVGRFNKDVPEILERMIMKCLDKDRENRYSDIESLVEDLKAAEESIGKDMPAKDLWWGYHIIVITVFFIALLKQALPQFALAMLLIIVVKIIVMAWKGVQYHQRKRLTSPHGLR
ncbi:MAG: protein kinase [Vulcanimicrobiota bacterium]